MRDVSAGVSIRRPATTKGTEGTAGYVRLFTAVTDANNRGVKMNRRGFLSTLTAGATAAALSRGSRAAAPGSVPDKSLAQIQQDWQALVPKGADVATSTAPIQKTDLEWKQSLSEQQFYVLRKESTEHPFSSPLNNEKRPGVFVCAGCSLPLFSSQMKFDSGTGWPSFFTSIPGHLATKQDFLLVVPRTEYHCIRCSGHQGHVFDDGPKPTGQRWCNNGVALRFIPATSKV
jgi:peptide-methionine (R)-S-oxide reductase